MNEHLKRLLASMARRNPAGAWEGGPLKRASHFAEPLRPCLGDEACSVALYESGDPAAWERSLKEAGERVTFMADDALVLRRAWAPGKRKDPLTAPPAQPAPAAAPDASAQTELVATPGAVMDFECVVTSVRKDRQGDVLEVDGAELDALAPLLWQHLPTMPIGRLVKETFRDAKLLKAHCAIADTPLGNDAAALVEFGALRISHGFNPLDLDEIESTETGAVSFHIRRYKILEISLVSVPANEDAVITAFSGGKLHHPIVKAWAARLRKSLPPVVDSGFARISNVPREMDFMHKCGCGTNGHAKDGGPPAPAPVPSAPPAVAPAVPSGQAQECPNKPEIMMVDGKCPMAEESRTDGLTSCRSCAKPIPETPGAVTPPPPGAEPQGEHTVPLGVAGAIPHSLRRVQRQTPKGKQYSATVGRLKQDGPEVDVRWHFPARSWTVTEVRAHAGAKRVVIASKSLTKKAREALTEAAELIGAALGQEEMKSLRVSRALLSQASLKIGEVVGTTDDTADEQRHEPNPEAGPEANPGVDKLPNPGVRDPERAATELMARLMSGDYPAWETMVALREEVGRHIDRMDEAALLEMAGAN